MVCPRGSGKTVTLQLPQLLGDIVGEDPGQLLLLDNMDNIEILFDVHLKQDPLHLLQGLFGSNTVGPPGMKRSGPRSKT
ncbi:hypothetical protein EM20IM_06185 [Candidatus Methylacidiphilum infernorum]|uniref:Uncharacterized protein n=1 Tax=Candidatus Methylacidiphilum infernorum TaxID=511746 RepID=A0ABX7PTL4_9BACT|nr:hypothetical protein [Candidatus Methylacidiphilum infernorum]QSR86099.1 hypothetical protein EM20IM_06185 [Candidatus Methylacidiphilum infernorum]